jgi:Secretion system C-terminal sorting domain/PA domain
MIKYLTSLVLLLAVATTTQAQAKPKKDTTVLSVYNNNQRFMLYPMPFGKDRPDADVTAEMVLALDTIHVLKTSTKKDSTGKYPKVWVTERKCGKMPTNIKGKVALFYINKECDISSQILNAQKGGAVAVILIHTTNNKDSVVLSKKSESNRYDDDVNVKIPCFTVRQGIGEKLTQLLPSLVGIKRPVADVGAIQSLTKAVVETDSMKAVRKIYTDSLVKAEYDKHLAAQEFNKIGWEVAPNPVSDEVTLHYNFTQKSTLNIEIFNEIGQITTTYTLPNTQTGKLNIDVTAWQTGAYSVSLISGSMREVKRLIIAH